MEWQKDDIEYAIESYADSMNQELFTLLSHQKADFLHDHTTFSHDIQQAIQDLEQQLNK